MAGWIVEWVCWPRLPPRRTYTITNSKAHRNIIHHRGPPPRPPALPSLFPLDSCFSLRLRRISSQSDPDVPPHARQSPGVCPDAAWVARRETTSHLTLMTAGASNMGIFRQTVDWTASSIMTQSAGRDDKLCTSGHGPSYLHIRAVLGRQPCHTLPTMASTRSVGAWPTRSVSRDGRTRALPLCSHSRSSDTTPNKRTCLYAHRPRLRQRDRTGRLTKRHSARPEYEAGGGAPKTVIAFRIYRVKMVFRSHIYVRLLPPRRSLPPADNARAFLLPCSQVVSLTQRRPYTPTARVPSCEREASPTR